MTITDTIEHLIEEEVRKGIEHFKNEYLNTSFEKNKLYNHLGKELVNLLKNTKRLLQAEQLQVYLLIKKLMM